MKLNTLAALIAVALFAAAAPAAAEGVKQTTTVEKSTDPLTGAQTTTRTTTRTEFATLDTDADGFIVVNEVPSSDPFAKVWVTYDKDGDKRITRVEYDAYTTAAVSAPATTSTTTTTTTRTTTRTEFTALDSDADGYIVVSEIPSTNEFSKVWVEYDKDGDKRITRVEYDPYYTVSVDIDED